MKKILALVLSVLMILALVACGQPAETTAPDVTEPENTETPDVPASTEIEISVEGTWGAAFWADFKNVVAANKGADADTIMAQLMSTESGMATSIMAVGSMPVETELPYEGFAHTGFFTYISGFKSASMLINMMMGGTPFLVYVFELDESANVREFVKLLGDNIDPDYMVCGSAETTTVCAVENYAITVLAPADMPNAQGGNSSAIEPELEGKANTEALWNDFVAYMGINGSFSLASDVADYLAGNELLAGGSVEILEEMTEIEGFAWSIEAYTNGAAVKAGDKAVYVFQIEMGMMPDAWGDYNLGMNAPEGADSAWGAYGNTLILMVNIEA